MDKNDIKLKSLIEKNIPTGNEENTVYQALELMIKKKQSCFIVLSQDNKILGLITLYDVLNKIIPYFIKIDNILNFISTNILLSKKKIKKLNSLKVKEIMTKKVYYLNEDDDIAKAIILMYIKNFDYIPVVDRDENYQGVITRINVEKTLIKLIKNLY